MSKDYQQGFKDGFAAGVEEGKKLAQPVSSPPPYMPQPSYPSFYPNMPNYPYVWSGSGGGAVGSNGGDFIGNSILLCEDDSDYAGCTDWAGNIESGMSEK